LAIRHSLRRIHRLSASAASPWIIQEFTHEFRMYSLYDAFSEQDMLDWQDRNAKILTASLLGRVAPPRRRGGLADGLP